MSEVAEEKSLKDMSLEEIKAYTANLENKAIKAEEKKKKEYEDLRDNSIEIMIQSALEVNKLMKILKDQCHNIMDKQQEALSEYGKMRSNSKGGFQITHSNGEARIIRRRDTEPSWDERAEKGVELVKDFMHDTIKKRDLELFEILLSFIEKNQKGDLEYAKVLGLIKYRKKFNDDRWTEGLRLIEESYTNHLKAYGYEFKIKDEHGKFINIDLSFSRL